VFLCVGKEPPRPSGTLLCKEGNFWSAILLNTSPYKGGVALVSAPGWFSLETFLLDIAPAKRYDFLIALYPLALK
jgi:hypothetical protein